MSSRRPGASVTNKAKSALERLKQQRQSGHSALRSYAIDNDDDARLYDEVDERDYELIRRKRLQEDDFVVDDDGLGYVDYGQDEAEDDAAMTSDDDLDNNRNGRKKGKEKKTSPKTANHGQNIAMLMQRQQHKNMSKRAAKNVIGPASAANTAQKRPGVEEEIDLDSMLDSLDQEAERLAASTMHQRKKAKSSLTDVALFGSTTDIRTKKIHNPPAPTTSTHAEVAMDPVDDDDVDHTVPDLDDNMPEDIPSAQSKQPSPEKQAQAISKEDSKAEKQAKETAEPEIIEPAKPVRLLNPKKGTAKTKSVSKIPAVLPSLPTPTFAASTKSQKEQSPQIQVMASSICAIGQKEFQANIVDEAGNGYVYMFWLDLFEKDGTVYLFGKVWNRAAKTFVSCCVTVTGIERDVYFLPRQKVIDVSGHVTDLEVDFQTVWEELDALFSKHKISNWAVQETKRKYAFEVPDVPVEADWVLVNYPYSMPQLPNDLTGRTFSKIFGASTNALETFILKTNLMGPCWIRIKESEISISWCRMELSVRMTTSDEVRLKEKDFINVLPLSDNDLDRADVPDYCKTAPPLVVMSMSMKTVMNYKKHTNEIAIVSGLVYHKITMDGATSEADKKYVSHFTAVRPLDESVLPMGFNDHVQRMKIEQCRNERALLNYVLAMIQQYDPDMIVGHNFIGFDLDVLLHRMKTLSVEHWSRLGRFPKLQAGMGGMGESTYQERMVTSGRLVCDSYLTSRDLIKSKSYSLTQLAQTVLKTQRPEVDLETIPQYFSAANTLVWLVQHCENDAFLSVSLVFQLMAIPLTKQLTNLAGNLWSRTLTGGRAERNEFLLLHEFTKNGYIVPDKMYPKLKEAVKAEANAKKNIKNAQKSKAKSTQPETYKNEQEDDDDEGQENHTSGRRKPAYAGGLVLEPKKGFYDKYVVMLDFNSLYPSIIQEYNICFTTVERKLASSPEEEEVPDLPDPSLEQGILPKLLATLVARRRQVKSLMKSLDSKTSEYAQLNIRQQALKLTANSMYGCLGFTHSRFYAKPLAMLITAKGREILQNTVDLAEQTLRLEVIYGDTDSIMVYTGTENLVEVKQMGQKLKAAVNKKYKLLEIEMDGFFQKMLLLKKKKYAALVVTESENGVLTTVKETKGLDLVRRDWCELSHDVSNYVLDQILSGLSREEVVHNIHDYLQNVGREARDGKVPIEKYVINKSLTKAPEEYNDAKVQPHVQVALRMKQKGISVRVGDTVPYVICKDADTSKSYALRAYHPDDLKKADSTLQIDIDYYLNNQIHPPVSRLCQPIEGTDGARIADCLGLDPAKFRSYSNANSYDDQQYSTFDSQISDQERFKDVDKWEVTCFHCDKVFLFEGLTRKRDEDVVSSCICPHCDKGIPAASLRAQMTVAIRKHLEMYYRSAIICEEPSCQKTTHCVSVYSWKCTNRFCKGKCVQQLIYYNSLVDVDRALKKLIDRPEEKNQLEAVTAVFLDDYLAVKQVIQSFLKQSGRNVVNLEKLFAFSKTSAGMSGMTGFSSSIAACASQAQ